jgi:hypothetical protein
MTDIQSNHCPQCGATMERGYLIGKQHQIRWSQSAEGMTIYHGVPLIRHGKDFWRQWQSWSYAPSITAVRCPLCRLVMFGYNNQAEEQPVNELRASTFMAGFLLLAAVLLLTITFWDWSPQPPIPLFFQLILTFISLVLTLMAGVFWAHVMRMRRVISQPG